MADNITISFSSKGASEHMKRMLDRASTIRGWLNRVAYPTIVEAQRMRWASEGATEGQSWRALEPSYAARKLKKWASAPGGGRKILIASSRLVKSVTGEDQKDHYKLVLDRSLEVGTKVEYAKYVNEERDFIRFSPQTRQDLTDKLNKYLREG